jgi:hypothetical protein
MIKKMGVKISTYPYFKISIANHAVCFWCRAVFLVGFCMFKCPTRARLSEGFIAPVRKLVPENFYPSNTGMILGILQEQSLAIHCANDSNDLKCSGSWPHCVS